MKKTSVKKILIIDDEKDFCFFIKENLELTGNFKVIVATDGKRGIWLAQQHKPDLILLDLIMPRIDGLEILKRLKEGKYTAFIPVVILSARADDETKVKAAGLFGEEYIVKPVTVEDLSSRIEGVLSRYRGR